MDHLFSCRYFLTFLYDSLEQALRNFTCLTQGDMIEISYNSITFQLLIMDILPDGPAISILDTDLEVDFAPPKGYGWCPNSFSLD